MPQLQILPSRLIKSEFNVLCCQKEATNPDKTQRLLADDGTPLHVFLFSEKNEDPDIHVVYNMNTGDRYNVVLSDERGVEIAIPGFNSGKVRHYSKYESLLEAVIRISEMDFNGWTLGFGTKRELSH